MIVGKDSAIKGFTLFFLLISSILVLVATILAGPYWWIVGAINLLIDVFILVKYYKTWQV